MSPNQMMFMDKSVAIIGGNGFVGSELTNSFIKKDFDTQIITRENYRDSVNRKYKYVINKIFIHCIL